MDGIDEVVSIAIGLEPDDGAAEKPLEQLCSPRADRIALRFRPRDVPEGDNRAERHPLAHHRRCQREVIVLDQDHRAVVEGFLRDGVHEARVRDPINHRGLGVKHRFDKGAMTQRPEHVIQGEAVVVAGVSSSVSQSLSSQPVLRRVFGNVDAVRLVHHSPVRATGPMAPPRRHHRPPATAPPRGPHPSWNGSP